MVLGSSNLFIIVINQCRLKRSINLQAVITRFCWWWLVVWVFCWGIVTWACFLGILFPPSSYHMAWNLGSFYRSSSSCGHSNSYLFLAYSNTFFQSFFSMSACTILIYLLESSSTLTVSTLILWSYTSASLSLTSLNLKSAFSTKVVRSFLAFRRVMSYFLLPVCW